MSETNKKTKLRPWTTARMRRMNKCHSSWKKFEPTWQASVKGINHLGIFQREGAMSHFLGGCSIELQSEGSISRKQFVRLLQVATEFGAQI